MASFDLEAGNSHALVAEQSSFTSVAKTEVSTAFFQLREACPPSATSESTKLAAVIPTSAAVVRAQDTPSLRTSSSSESTLDHQYRFPSI